MFKALLLACGFVYLLLIGAWFYERKAHLQAIQKLSMYQAELKSTQENLIKYTELYSELKNKCELDKRKIEQRYTALLKKASEPIPQVSIPTHTDECEALKEMLNEASKHFSP
jgi:DNA repair exonuclease SbcCD ATPase subunit